MLHTIYDAKILYCMSLFLADDSNRWGHLGEWRTAKTLRRGATRSGHLIQAVQSPKCLYEQYHLCQLRAFLCGKSVLSDKLQA